MFPVVDFSSKFTVDNTEFAAAQTYTFTAKDNLAVLLREISVGGDGTFFTDGQLQMEIGGRAFTSQNAVNQETSPVNVFTVRFADTDKVFLQPGESLVVRLKSPSGAGGSAQVQVTGVQLNQQEFKQLVERDL